MQDWTRFRGPDGSGVGEARGLVFPRGVADFAWRTALPGEGHSSPVVWGNRLFVTAADAAKGRRFALCLDTELGRILWSRGFDYQAYRVHDYNTAASATPAVDARCVYLTWPAPEAFVVVALTHEGREVWRRDLGAFPTQHGGASSPVIEGGLLLFGAEPENADGALYGLDTASGRTLWKRPRPSGPAPYATPLLYRPKGGLAQALFTSTARGLTAIDPKTGRALWEVADLFRLRCVGSPILAGGLVIATSGEGGGARLTVAVDPVTKAVRWRRMREASYVPTPLAIDNRLFFWGDGGIVSCVEASTGETLWSERVGGSYFGSPVRADGRLWAMSASGELVAVAEGASFRLHGRCDLGEPSHATPAVAGGRLFLRTRGHVLALAG